MMGDEAEEAIRESAAVQAVKVKVGMLQFVSLCDRQDACSSCRCLHLVP